jgi:hypothetical protein
VKTIKTGFGYYCDCGWKSVGDEIGATHHHGGRIPLSWLKRIPPLAELEGQRTEETLHV